MFHYLLLGEAIHQLLPASMFFPASEAYFGGHVFNDKIIAVLVVSEGGFSRFDAAATNDAIHIDLLKNPTVSFCGILFSVGEKYFFLLFFLIFTHHPRHIRNLVVGVELDELHALGRVEPFMQRA